MYAIVNIAGQQFKVKENTPVFIHRLEANEGDSVNFNEVLLVDNNGSIKVGAPLLAGASVSAKVLSHLKGDKVLIFKKKRRKGYQKLNGHRQYLTKIHIEKITA
jgi:large subunit ribosomal protein L21